MMNDVVCKYTSNPALLVISGSLLTRTLVTADAGAQYGVQCWCMPGMFPAAGVDVKEAENAAGSCDVKCKGKPSEVCGGGWHNTVIRCWICLSHSDISLAFLSHFSGLSQDRLLKCLGLAVRFRLAAWGFSLPDDRDLRAMEQGQGLGVGVSSHSQSAVRQLLVSRSRLLGHPTAVGQ